MLYIKVLMLIAKHSQLECIGSYDSWHISYSCLHQSSGQSEQRSLPYRDNSFLEYSKTLYMHSSIESLNKYSSQNISHLFETEVPYVTKYHFIDTAVIFICVFIGTSTFCKYWEKKFWHLNLHVLIGKYM